MVATTVVLGGHARSDSRSGVRFAYREPGCTRLETTAALVALLATFLVAGRFLGGGRVDDLF
jgi:hypothetical protein